MLFMLKTGKMFGVSWWVNHINLRCFPLFMLSLQLRQRFLSNNPHKNNKKCPFSWQIHVFEQSKFKRLLPVRAGVFMRFLRSPFLCHTHCVILPEFQRKLYPYFVSYILCHTLFYCEFSIIHQLDSQTFCHTSWWYWRAYYK